MSVSRALAAGVVLVAATSAVMMGLAGRTRLPSQTPAHRLTTARALLPTPFLMFRTLAPPAVHDRVAMVALRGRPGSRAVTPISCARLHAGGGRGLCLVEELDGSTTRHAAIVFDAAFRQRYRIPLPGVPTRVRVAPNGRLGSVSTYAEEESPAGERLALESILIDLDRGQVVADLREFALETPTGTLDAPHDFASVAFDADSDRFYATVSAPAGRHLVIGSVRDRRLRAIGAGFANEALSPDGRRLIIKRVSERGFWQLSILDLATRREHRIEHGTRSIDDQVEWLDDRTVMFHDAADAGTGIWRVSVDGESGPELHLADAYSPVVVRR